MTLWFPVKIWYNNDAGKVRPFTVTTTRKGIVMEEKKPEDKRYLKWYHKVAYG